jgi:hypothetical protein
MFNEFRFIIIPFLCFCFLMDSFCQVERLKINENGYYELPGLNVMVFDDFYPEGHQGGVTLVQFGKRVAANGDVRLEPTPGQWAPVPKVGGKNVDRENGIIKVQLSYPDSSKDRKGYNPLIYPDLNFQYTVKTEAVGQSLKLVVDLEKPLSAEWDGKIGFNLELFPGQYFGEFYLMDGKTGIFPRQANDKMETDANGNLQSVPMATGKQLIVGVGNSEKEIKFVSNKSDLQLYDGRGLHNNGWFVLRSVIPAGETKNVIEWIIIPRTNTNWRYKPVIQVSQVGYHPKQVKFAVIELDKLTYKFDPIQLIKINENSQIIVKSDNNPVPWGKFLRYKYLRFDFSDIKDEGLYKIKYSGIESNLFEIKVDVFSRYVWQPTLEYFLPVQMCHMRVNENYRVWHGLCHMDDALMAPTNYNHFDGYYQHESTLTKYKSGDHVPGLNIGGWHDAGDDDLRIESQAETVYKLSLAYELFKTDYDQTTINQETRIVEIREPDGKPDILQQIEHGLLSIVGAYESMGRLYRGIISPTLKQYVLLGDWSTMTDNLIYKPDETDPVLKRQLPPDDRLVFTEENPQREMYTARVLAASYRTMKDFNPTLADKCLRIAEVLYKNEVNAEVKDKINAVAELYLSTSKEEYRKSLLDNLDLICSNINDYCLIIGRITDIINNRSFTSKIETAVKEFYNKIYVQQKENPYGVPYKPYIWGAGWGIQSFGVDQLFLHLGFPEIFKSEYVFNALNFILGVHPGENTASFASGVGVNSLTVAYGINRADWSYIPGGIGSGTALIRPDLPELKTWPFFWQQTEYVLGGGTIDYLLLALAADNLFNK